MKNGIAEPVTWTTKTRGWHWVGPDSWEIIRDVDPHTDRTRFGVWQGHIIVDYQSTLALAQASAKEEMEHEPQSRSRFPHRLSGSDPERQSVGDPGHCEACCAVGHVVAHPDLGCGDVGCVISHV